MSRFDLAAARRTVDEVLAGRASLAMTRRIYDALEACAAERAALEDTLARIRTIVTIFVNEATAKSLEARLRMVTALAPR